MKSARIHSPFRLRISLSSAAASAVLGSLFLLGPAPAALAQGSLTPPGAPAPTMRTLDQIEPRKPISGPFTIGSGGSGSYYLTTNIIATAGIVGIAIFANDVTVDLNGFTMSGTNGSDVGFYLDVVTNVTVRNGTVRNFSSGAVEASQARNCRFENLQINHCAAGGLLAGTLCVVEDCTVNDCGSSGITAFSESRVTHCTVVSNSAYGISAGDGTIIEGCIVRTNRSGGIAAGFRSQVRNCVCEFNSGEGIFTSDHSLVEKCQVVGHTSNGIDVRRGCRVQDCVVANNGGSGITTDRICVITGCVASTNALAGISTSIRCVISGCMITGSGLFGIGTGDSCKISDCDSSGNTGPGIQVTFGCEVLNNTCNSGVAEGIFATAGQNRIDSNHVMSNARGINSLGNNLIIRNSASGNGTNYFFSVSGLAGQTNNFATGGIITNNSPWLNFSY